ncbi:hypothetical protein [Moorena producens]|uniref:hypothetical protein n=1 Tax=Moorena producens TaxID=1155739 RepID=UPI0011EA6C19|nr:hypothetical protein [Moorena producens]
MPVSIPRHLACFNSEASCLFQFRGILPVSIPRHLACFNSEASCLFQFRGILPVSIPRRAVPTRGEEAENEGSPLGGALRGGVYQRWLQSETSEAFRP